MSTLEQPFPIVLHADQEHGGITLTVPFILLITLLGSYALIKSFFNTLPEGGVADYDVFLSCVGALPLALGVAALSEYALKRIWPSGRQITLDDSGIVIQYDPEEEPLYIDWDKRITTTLWYVPLKGYSRGGRERRVPNSWFCLGCQVQQDEERFIVHGYLSPTKATELINIGKFHQLDPSDFYEPRRIPGFLRAPSRPEIPAKILAGNDGAYWLAEKRRWREGLELTAVDFEIFANQLIKHTN